MRAEEIRIREACSDDIAGLYKILNNAVNQRLVGGSMSSMSHTEVQDWLDQKTTDESTFLFSILSKDDFLGYLLVTSIDQRNGHAVFGINLLDSAQGQGVGQVAMCLAHSFCKKHTSIRKLVLYVRTDNHNAIRLYKNLGYRLVGTLDRHVRDSGKYLDQHIMEKFL